MARSNKQIYRRGDMIVFALDSNPTENSLYPGKGARGEVQEIRSGVTYELLGTSAHEGKMGRRALEGCDVVVPSRTSETFICRRILICTVYTKFITKLSTVCQRLNKSGL